MIKNDRHMMESLMTAILVKYVKNTMVIEAMAYEGRASVRRKEGCWTIEIDFEGIDDPPCGASELIVMHRGGDLRVELHTLLSSDPSGRSTEVVPKTIIDGDWVQELMHFLDTGV